MSKNVTLVFKLYRADIHKFWHSKSWPF